MTAPRKRLPPLRPRAAAGVALTPEGAWAITLPYVKPPLTANDSNRMHHQARHRIVAQIQQAVVALARRRVPHLERCSVVLEWHAPDKRRRDGDNLAPTLKAAQDALVKAGVIDDDNANVVTQSTCRFINSSDGWGGVLYVIPDQI